MSKGFSINGYVFLLVLLSLFAALFYAGGIKSRREYKVLTLEAQFAQEALIHYLLVLDQKDMVITQQDSMINALRQDNMEYRWMYLESVKGEAMLRKEFEAYKKSQDSIKAWHNLVPWFTDIPRFH